jgi:hypothetical protein
LGFWRCPFPALGLEDSLGSRDESPVKMKEPHSARIKLKTSPGTSDALFRPNDEWMSPRSADSAVSFLLLAIAAFAVSATGGDAAAAKSVRGYSQNDGFIQVDESKNVSQLIRSNSNHYWKFMKKDADLHLLAPYIHFQGVVVGDPHLGNFAPVPVATANGRRSIKFVDIDFDDAGRAPLVLDFTRLMVATKAVSRDLKAADLTDAYVSGLRGEDRQPPAVIQRALSLTMPEYDEMVERYTAKKIDGERFRYEKGDVVAYDGTASGAVTREEIQAIFPKARVLDYAARVKDRGGSAGSLRFWVLVDESGTKRIYELKGYSASGVSAYQDQMTPVSWLRDINSVFRAGLDTSAYTLVVVGKSSIYWAREKKLNLVDVDYNGKSAEEKNFAIELALFDGWYLGRLHGMQPSARQYTAKIEKDRYAFKEAVKAVAKEYLHRALEAFEAAND